MYENYEDEKILSLRDGLIQDLKTALLKSFGEYSAGHSKVYAEYPLEELMVIFEKTDTTMRLALRDRKTDTVVYDSTFSKARLAEEVELLCESPIAYRRHIKPLAEQLIADGEHTTFIENYER